MSARIADVQTYNIIYLINISGAVAVPWTPVQNVCQRQSAYVPQIPLFILAYSETDLPQSDAITTTAPLTCALFADCFEHPSRSLRPSLRHAARFTHALEMGYSFCGITFVMQIMFCNFKIRFVIP